MAAKRILIIKHGFSETCESAVTRVVSYGDVFRCTCLLEDFRGAEVTWITSVAARDLLVGNHLIDRLLVADTPADLPGGAVAPAYDMVVNLEKQPDWCAFAAGLEAETRYGFRDWSAQGDDAFYPASAAALRSALAGNHDLPLQETLFQSVGRQWTGQRYVLGHQPRVAEIYDIGLNYHIGPKWPTKAWPKAYWQQLHDELSERYALNWQQSLNSVRHYIDWLASCRLIVTTDSLGLHLALGLQKKVVALFGPTSSEQVYMYGCGVKLTAECDRPCVPCFQPRCAFDTCCMEYIPVERVAEAVEMLMNPAPMEMAPRRVAQPVNLVQVSG